MKISAAVLQGIIDATITAGMVYGITLEASPRHLDHLEVMANLHPPRERTCTTYALLVIPGRSLAYRGWANQVAIELHVARYFRRTLDQASKTAQESPL